jgi:arabinofuranosyltransferase
MDPRRERAWFLLLTAAAAAALVNGWRHFWFLCDDAFIAFRYVANGAAGLGYTWNPPPFPPVEGYTSFLWVALLEGIWRLTGAAPPEVANGLSLACALGTLGLLAGKAWRMDRGALGGLRLPACALVLLTVVSNRTFLAWSSSGLETALFNLLVVGWVFAALRGRHSEAGPAAALAALASLAALTRPDGLLYCAATGALLLDAARRGRPRAALVGAAPLLAVAAHLLWRRATYGWWLPNTYYAKVGGAWPEAGARYMASFALEYGYWIWALAALAAGAAALRARRLPSAHGAAAAGAVAAHVAYYTLVVGGDHFEFRVYSHLVPLLALSLPWLLLRAGLKPGAALGVATAALLVGLPIPWTHRALALEHSSRLETDQLVLPVAEHLPPPLSWLARPWDAMQSWLILHNVGRRHREHDVTGRLIALLAPDREAVISGRAVAVLREDPGSGALRLDPTADPLAALAQNPVWTGHAVGIYGWALAPVAVVDLLGLNDPAVAHLGTRRDDRRMAHELDPPPGYSDCLRPNVATGLGRRNPETGRIVGVQGPGEYTRWDVDEAAPWGPGLEPVLIVTLREPPLTDEELAGCLARFDPLAGR